MEKTSFEYKDELHNALVRFLGHYPDTPRDIYQTFLEVAEAAMKELYASRPTEDRYKLLCAARDARGLCEDLIPYEETH